jgi:XTP/dITP diphosphohydrolase|tara:strand:+ start:1549 stop:2145 length:597 start_codon:yes stop_codon:yes gene_type:complete
MKKIKEILIGTNNIGKYEEICNLLPTNIKKYSLRQFNILSPKETGKSFRENALIKASYFSKKTNLICLSDDSGLEIEILRGQPGIFSSRWSGKKNNFNLAIRRVYKEMNKINKNWKNKNKAQFVCCLTIFWPNKQSFSAEGVVKGKIAEIKKGKKGFGYDPIFIPGGYNKTFAEMNPQLKMSMDHRFKAFCKIKKYFV